MSKRSTMVAALSFVALGVGANVAFAATEYSEASIKQCAQTTGSTEPECACNIALEDGSELALASFLANYGDEAQNTACAALAQTLIQRGNDDSSPRLPNNGGDTGGDGYGG